jgi:hypothetical protein
MVTHQPPLHSMPTEPAKPCQPAAGSVPSLPPYRPPRQMLTDQASNVLSKYTFGTLCYWVRSLDMFGTS